MKYCNALIIYKYCYVLVVIVTSFADQLIIIFVIYLAFLINIVYFSIYKSFLKYTYLLINCYNYIYSPNNLVV